MTEKLKEYLKREIINPEKVLNYARWDYMEMSLNTHIFLIRAENHIAEHRRKLSKKTWVGHSPWGKCVGFHHERTLFYKGNLISIKRFLKDDGPMYVSGRCHYDGDRHSTLRGAIRCAKERIDKGKTWNG